MAVRTALVLDQCWSTNNPSVMQPCNNLLITAFFVSLFMGLALAAHGVSTNYSAAGTVGVAWVATYPQVIDQAPEEDIDVPKFPNSLGRLTRATFSLTANVAFSARVRNNTINPMTEVSAGYQVYLDVGDLTIGEASLLGIVPSIPAFSWVPAFVGGINVTTNFVVTTNSVPFPGFPPLTTFVGQGVGQAVVPVGVKYYYSAGAFYPNTTLEMTNTVTVNISVVYEYECPVKMLQKAKFSSLGYTQIGLTTEMLTAISGLEAAIGSGNIVAKTSGYRSQAYQDHLYEIWANANSLRKIKGIKVTSTNPLQFSAMPGCPECQAEVEEINAEIVDHFPNSFPPKVAKYSRHSDGKAVDWTISSAIAASQIKAIADANNLNWKVPGEPWHFSLKDSVVDNGLVVSAHSPVNILLTDPSGRKVGFDPIAATVINDIGPEATFSGVGTTPQTIEIEPSEVLFGDYIVTGTGTGIGEYIIDMEVHTKDAIADPVQTIIASGIAQMNQPLAPIAPIDAVASTLRLSYETDSGNFILRGPAWASNAVVEWATNVPASSWTELTTTFDPSIGILATNQISGTRFFRLRLP